MFLHISYLDNCYSNANDKPLNCKCTSAFIKENNAYHLKAKLSCFCIVVNFDNYYSSANDKPLNCKCIGGYTKTNNAYHLKRIYVIN
jgi:hypothetical protein